MQSYQFHFPNIYFPFSGTQLRLDLIRYDKALCFLAKMPTGESKIVIDTSGLHNISN